MGKEQPDPDPDFEGDKADQELCRRYETARREEEE
jgi:hypothetical protein